MIHKSGGVREDDLSLLIYSDVLEQMFECGSYNFRQGSILNFYGLEIPCENYILIGLHSNKSTMPWMRYPCTFEGYQGADFIITNNT